MSLPKELRDREFEKFKKEGIFNVNSAILTEKYPDRSKLLKERKQSNELVVCSLCRGFFSKKTIYRHKRKCVAAESTTDYPETFSLGLLRPEPGFSDKYRHTILESFHDTEVGTLIKNDDWIKRYGYFSFKNSEGTEKSADKRKTLMSNLRRLAQLYSIFRDIMKKENPSVILESCSQMFDRDYIMYIQEAITVMTTNSSTGEIKNGLKVSLRYLIKDVCKVMRANYYLIRQDEKAEEMNKFMTVLQIIWPSFFASAEESVIKKRQSDLRRPLRLPSEAEIMKLRDFNKDGIESLSSDLYRTLNYNQFCRLRDAVVCRLTLYNARRGGEPCRMTLNNWDDALKGVWIDPSKVEDVKDEIEKKLLCETKIAYIHASKVAKLVPLLIPIDCWQAMKVLTDLDIRRGAEIHVKNHYCFPNVKHSLNHCTGWICVNNMCKKAGLAHCINATDMRHYVATAYALLDVSASDREMFYKHLGHSQSMNENVYQCPPAMRTITTVGRFLNTLEGNRHESGTFQYKF
jgi:integrase